MTVYVTNGITLAQKLAQRGLKTLLIAGRVKATTDAVIGTEAVALPCSITISARAFSERTALLWKRASQLLISRRP